MNRRIKNALEAIINYRNRIQEKLFLNIIYFINIRRNIRVHHILDPKLTEILLPLADQRDWPGNPQLQSSGWSKKMFLRYALAMHYGKKKTVLDSCCGIGWGAYLLDMVTQQLFAVDLDEPSLEVAKRLWPCRNTAFINASVLDLPFPDNKFKLVTAMESIEHFSVPNRKKYLGELNRVLKPKGILIGSSSFPESSKEAEAICACNPHHINIATRLEMIEQLKENGFEKIKIFNNRLFFMALKSGGNR